MKGKQIKTQNIPQKPTKIHKKTSIKETILEMNTEFDETIYFNHQYSAFRNLSVEKPISQKAFPFLMIREFLFSYFEEKIINKEPDKETIPQILGHIKQFSDSHDLNFIKNFLGNMKTYAEVIGMKNTSNLLVPALAKILDETYQAKIHFLKSLLPFIDYLCTNQEEGINILKNNIINIIQELYNQSADDNISEEMKKLLFLNFVKIAKAILPYDNEEFILTIILDFANEERFKTKYKNTNIDEFKCICIQYIRVLADNFGSLNTEKYLLPNLKSFSYENNNHIKKELLYAIPNISELISAELISTRIYDILSRLVTDKNPEIRKICVKVLAKVIKIYKNKCKEDNDNDNTNNINGKEKEEKKENCSAKNFIELIEKLTRDRDNNVKYTIIETLGEIISPLDKKELSKDIFDFYKKFVEKLYEEKKNQLPLGATLQTTINPLYKKIQGGANTNPSGINDEILEDYDSVNGNVEKEYNTQITQEELYYYFAYNFPAILFCYGKQSWPELKNIYFDFCFEEDIKIRLSIVASFHEIANILGKEITENELLPIYDKFLESNEKYEQKLAIKNLPTILNPVSKTIKERYFKYFEPVSILMDNTGNKVRTFNFLHWKNKLNVIEGVLCYYNLYENDIIYNLIFPQCITFCLDKVYKVRKTSAKVLATLIDYLYKENYKKDKLFKILENFAFHKKFQYRINFIKMCQVLLADKDLYDEKIKHLLEILVYKDKILDIKIALSKVLKKIIVDSKHILYKDEFIHRICYFLSKNKTIKQIFGMAKIQNLEDEKDNDKNFSDDKNNHFKEDNTFLIEEFKIELEPKVKNEENNDFGEIKKDMENSTDNNNIKKDEKETIIEKNKNNNTQENENKKEEAKNEKEVEIKNTEKNKEEIKEGKVEAKEEKNEKGVKEEGDKTKDEEEESEEEGEEIEEEENPKDNKKEEVNKEKKENEK